MTDDQDPTGMSHLLAGLRETGPMPDDLNDRIRASLAGEEASRSGVLPEDADLQAGPESSDEEREAADRSAFWAEMDNDGRSPSRRSTPAGRWVLGIAAAAVVVMGIGGIFAIRGGDDSADDSAASASQQAGSSGSASEGESAPADQETPAFAVTESGRTYTKDGFGDQASEVYANPNQGKAVKNDTLLGSLGTAAGAKDCLTRLGSPELQPVVIDVATFGDTPGVLIIAEPVPEGSPEAWAVTTGCEKIWDGPTEVSTSD